MTQIFERLIDLGCGQPDPDLIGMLPKHRKYLGVDTQQIDLNGFYKFPNNRFINSDAISALSELAPRSGDLVVSLMSAHHIGTETLLLHLESLRARGCQYIVVDAALMFEWSFVLHFAHSAISSGVGSIFCSARVGRNAQALLRRQAKFLLSSQGWGHARADFESGDQLPLSSLRERDDFLSFGSLWSLTSGECARSWIRS